MDRIQQASAAVSSLVHAHPEPLVSDWPLSTPPTPARLAKTWEPLSSPLSGFPRAGDVSDATGYRMGFCAETGVKDRLLRVRARLQARMDRALGQALLSMRERSAYKELGFVRFSDYVRETLRMSLRSVQQMMHTEKCLTNLADIAAAWDSGLLQAEQVRLLCRVAQPGEELRWIGRAQRLSVRKLAAEVQKWEAWKKQVRQDEGTGGTVADRVPAAMDGEMGGATDGEDRTHVVRAVEAPQCAATGAEDRTHAARGDEDPECAATGSEHRECDAAPGDAEAFFERISFPAPIPFAMRWRLALRLCSAVSGADLPDWALVEGVCAEYLAGSPLPDVRSPLPDPLVTDSGQGLDAASRLGGDSELVAGKQDATRHTAREEENDGGCEGPEDPPDFNREASTRPHWIPEQLDAFLSRPPPAAPWALHARIVRLADLRARLVAHLSRRLFLFVYDEYGQWQAGYRGARAYAREVLGLGERKARYLLSLERKLHESPILQEEYRRGRLSWLQCVLVLRVVHGPGSQRAWAEYARQVSMRRLQEAVEDGEIRVHHEYPCLPPPIVTFEPEAGFLENRNVSAHALRLGMQRSGEPNAARFTGTGNGGSGGGQATGPCCCAEYDCDECHGARDLAEDGPSEPYDEADRGMDSWGRQAFAHPCPRSESGPRGACESKTSSGDDPAGVDSWDRQPSAPPGGRQGTMRIGFSAPADVAALWRHALAEARRAEGAPLEDWEAADRMLEAFVAAWDGELARTLRKEYRVLERDQWRCTVPGCTSRQNLQAHHVLFRSQGGSDADMNMTTLCAGHHMRQVHGADAGSVLIQGVAPGRLKWTLGGRWEGSPAMIFRGERCVFRLGELG